MIVVLTGLLAISNSTISSSLPTGALPYMSDEFDVSSDEQLALPISLFLVGYVFGPIIFAPLSEKHGRKAVLIPCFVVYTAFTLACALAPNWPSLLVFRLFVGTAASAPYTIVGGVFADIYNDKLSRGRAITVLLAVGCEILLAGALVLIQFSL
jgi:MFS family permease